MRVATATGALSALVLGSFAAIVVFGMNGHPPTHRVSGSGCCSDVAVVGGKPGPIPSGYTTIASGLLKEQLARSHVDGGTFSGSSRSAGVRSSSRRRSRPQLPVGLRVSIGFGNRYRWLSTVPVRVVAHNRTNAPVSGTVTIPTSHIDVYADQEYGPITVYQRPLTLPAKATRTVTLNLPAWALSYTIQARLSDSSGHLIGSGSESTPPSYDANEMTVAAVAVHPSETDWVRLARPGGGEYVRTFSLRPKDLPALPSILLNFSDVVLPAGAASKLSALQLNAIEQYVEGGGGLVLTAGGRTAGGLSRLPSDLRPGTVSGTRTLSAAGALTELLATAPVAASAAQRVTRDSDLHMAPLAITGLRDPAGQVLASQNGIPLITDRSAGQGHVVFVGFDPSKIRLSDAGESRLFARLLIRGNPSGAALGENWTIANSDLSPSPWFNLPFNVTSDMGSDLKVIPAAALPSVILFVVLAALFVLLLGPLTFGLLRRWQRAELAWAILPIGALVATGATFGVSQATKARAAIVNTVGTVTLTGSPTNRPAEFYTGLFAPLGGDYDLAYSSPGVPQLVPDPARQSTGPALLRLREGSTTQAVMPHMGLWAIRSAGISTSIRLPGRIDYDLRIGSDGYLSGWVRNDTGVSLVEPSVIAGQSFARLPSLPPGRTARVLIRPGASVHGGDHRSIWQHMYGSYPGWSPYSNCCYDAAPQGIPASRQSSNGIQAGGGGCVRTAGGGCGSCCFGFGPIEKDSLSARIRDAATQLPDEQHPDTVGEVLFAGWTEAPIAPVTVDGVGPTRRDLTLLTQPLYPHFGSGSFRFRSGTFGATLVDVAPAAADADNCCSMPAFNAIEVGYGGSATYEFDLPDAARVYLTRLSLYVNAGGASGRDMGRVWSWTAHTWVHYDLRDGFAHLLRPQQFVSTAGTVLVKLVTFDQHLDMIIADPHQAIQITGSGFIGAK